MKKWLVPVIIIGLIVLAFYSWGKGFNNTAVEMNENVSEAWGNVQTSYQRRNDLIGNLVNTVKGAAAAAAKLGVYMFHVHASGGEDATAYL